MARLTIDIQMDNCLFDLEEGYMETSLLVYRALIPELQTMGDVEACRIFLSSGQKEADEKSAF